MSSQGLAAGYPVGTPAVESFNSVGIPADVNPFCLVETRLGHQPFNHLTRLGDQLKSIMILFVLLKPGWDTSRLIIQLGCDTS
jgi:hypothetical protein